MAINQSPANYTVPQSERRSPLTMGLLWITMVTSFPCVLMGFDWFNSGFSLSQIILCSILSCLILLAYTIPTTQLAALTGKGYALLNNQVFGKFGGVLTSLNMIWIFTGWYGLYSLLMAEGINSFFHTSIPLPYLAVIFAVAMAFNNFFGFTGIANFARYMAAPVLIIWISSTFVKAASICPPSALTAPSHQSFVLAMTTISSFVIGFAVWGNEADYWRYGKARVTNSLIPISLALLIGVVIFPVAGWMVAKTTSIVDHALATNFINSFCFSNISWLCAIVLVACYFAGNDSNLFGSTSAIENLFPLKHRFAVTIMAALGMITAFSLASLGTTKALEAVASLNCVMLPTPSVIVLIEWLLASKVFGNASTFLRAQNNNEIIPFRPSAITALFAGITVGIITSGIIPQLELLHVGICSLQAWLAAAVVYVPLRLYEYKLEYKTKEQKEEVLLQTAESNKELELV